MSLSQEQIAGIRAILPEAAFETDNEGQVVIYTGQYETDELVRCDACRVPEHDVCALVDDCLCCADTLAYLAEEEGLARAELAGD